MARLLSLTRAARLAGTRRGVLQGMMQRGELTTFEGMVSEEELLRAFPETALAEDVALERFEHLKDSAYSKRLRERVLPNIDVLIARLTVLTQELARLQAQAEVDRDTMRDVGARLRELARSGSMPQAMDELVALLEGRLDRSRDSPEAPILSAKERLLKIMAAHVRVFPSGHEFFVDGNDSLLDAALRSGLSLNYGCSSGTCGQCKARIRSGEVRKVRHSDYVLTSAERSAGFVLLCCNTPVADLEIETQEAQGPADIPQQRIETKVKSVTAINDEMRLVHLQTPRSQRLRFLAGQSVRLSLADGSDRTLPVASCPCDDRNLHFHVARRAGDPFAERVHTRLTAGDSILVQGPAGEFVLDEASPRTLVFVAQDTGFAPIKSLIEHAMALETAPAIHLVWVASPGHGHYLDNLCRSWSAALDEFHYVPITASGDLKSDIRPTIWPALEMLPSENACDHYVAGSTDFVALASELIAHQGAQSAHVRAFVTDGAA